jgi:hypothetical protein
MVLFRPSKKRKIYRQRAADDDEAPSPPSTTAAPVPQSIDELIADAAGDEMEDTAVSMADILRLRKQKKRVGGVEFRAAETMRGDESSLVVRSPDAEEGDGERASKVVRQFAPQTGIGGAGMDVDRHM